MGGSKDGTGWGWREGEGMSSEGGDEVTEEVEARRESFGRDSRGTGSATASSTALLWGAKA
jgi:hypothetical protein